jgi:tetratricopeptide (TPR) repeat protein
MRSFKMLFLLCLLSVGNTETGHAAEPLAIPLLKNSIAPVLLELPTQALSQWRKFRGTKPALVLLSKDPFLQTIPAQLSKEALRLVAKGSDEELETRLFSQSSSPLLRPKMALSTAMRADLFSKVYWLIPSTAKIEQFSIDIFRQQLIDSGAASQKEARAFTMVDGIFSGSIQGVPFKALHPSALLDIKGPALLHIDLSYFSPLYKDEVKTPVYVLIYQTLRQLRQASLQGLAVSISAGNQTHDVPLGSRFMLGVMERLFKEPQLLDSPLLPDWEQRRQALLLPIFFKYELERDTYLKMIKDAPSDASLHYGLHHAYRNLKKGDHALDSLAKAVSLDPIYALAYLELAALATEKHRPDQALRMLRLAGDNLPSDPFIQLNIVRALLSSGQVELAAPLLEQLRLLPWSAVYYSDMQQRLRTMSETM